MSLCKGALSDGSALGTTGSVVWDTDTAEFERVVAAQTRVTMAYMGLVITRNQ